LLVLASPDEPAPSLRPHYTGFTATTGRSASARRDGTQHLTVSAAWCAPSRALTGRSINARLPVFPHVSRRPGSRHLHAGHRLASNTGIPPSLSRGGHYRPDSDAVFYSRRFSGGSLAFAFPVPAW